MSTFAMAGFRDSVTKLNSNGDWLDRRGGVLYAEVTNNGGSTVTFYPNGFVTDPTDLDYTGSIKPDGIPIPAGQTRGIPMRLYNFSASGNVDVVGYRM